MMEEGCVHKGASVARWMDDGQSRCPHHHTVPKPWAPTSGWVRAGRQRRAVDHLLAGEMIGPGGAGLYR